MIYFRCYKQRQDLGEMTEEKVSDIMETPTVMNDDEEGNEIVIDQDLTEN